MRSKLFAANWKMAKDFSQSIEYCTKNKKQLDTLSHTSNAQLVICPSFPALFPIINLLQKTSIAIGAQTCSPYESGPFTGQVSAQSLKEVGCTFCIVGHSEQRAIGASDQIVAQQIKQLLSHQIEPIICIGEDHMVYEDGNTIPFLEAQLKAIEPALKSNIPLTIAYEPLWAIGTGNTPSVTALTTIFAWLSQKTNHRLIYGGSVSPENAATLSAIVHLDGFLIGSASLDFQNFEKIVSLAS